MHGTKQNGGQDFIRWKSEGLNGEGRKLIYYLILSLKPYLVRLTYYTWLLWSLALLP